MPVAAEVKSLMVRTSGCGLYMQSAFNFQVSWVFVVYKVYNNNNITYRFALGFVLTRDNNIWIKIRNHCYYELMYM